MLELLPSQHRHLHATAPSHAGAHGRCQTVAPGHAGAPASAGGCPNPRGQQVLQTTHPCACIRGKEEDGLGLYMQHRRHYSVLPPGHAAQCTGFGLGASWPLTGPARGNRRAESLPSLRLNLQAQNSVSSGRVQLPQPSPWGRLAGLHLPCSYVPEGSRRVFPSFNHPLQPPQTQCKPSSCGISAWGGESLLPHHAPWLPGQCHAAPLVCLPGSEAFHTLP